MRELDLEDRQAAVTETQFTARQVELEHAAEALVIERGNRIAVRRAVSVISSPKRAATSLSPRTFSALRGAAMVQRRAPEFIFWVLKEPNLRSITMPVITGIPSGAVIKLIGY